MLGRLPRYNRERTWHEICVKDAPRKKKKNKAAQRAPLRIWSRWHRLGIHYECILSSLITLFVGLIAVLLKTGWAGGSFVPELMMSLCDRAGCEGWGHWNRLRGAAVRVLVWLAAAVIRPLCLQQGPTELPWQGPMFPTPPDSPDGPSDTEGEEGGRESVEIDRERGGKESQKRRRKWEKGEESIIRGERKNPGRKKIAQRNGGLFPESLLTALLLANTGRARWLGIRAGMFAQHLFFCSLAVTLKRAWVRNLIGGRHSWAQHNYKNPRSHTIAATHTHTHTHSNSPYHSQESVFICTERPSHDVWRGERGFSVAACGLRLSHHSRVAACGLPPQLYMRNPVSESSCNTFHIRPHPAPHCHQKSTNLCW